MSNISEQIKRIDELEERVAILEKVIVSLIDKKEIQDFSGQLHDIGEIRNPIGFHK